jgi:hypothetical protein
MRLAEAAPVTGTVAQTAPKDVAVAATARLNVSVTSISIGPLSMPVSCATATHVALALDSTQPEGALSTGLAFTAQTAIPLLNGGPLCALLELWVTDGDDPYNLAIAP